MLSLVGYTIECWLCNVAWENNIIWNIDHKLIWHCMLAVFG